VVELLSMVFNFYLVKVNIGDFEYYLNFSIVFFCLGFFVVDIVADQFSTAEAKNFIFYKLFSQSFFLILGNVAIKVYGLEETQLARSLNKTPLMIIAALIATYAGFHIMSSIMSYMKIGVYQGSSVFKRYLYSTIPGELVFSFVFTFLCFYNFASFDEVMHIFVSSAIVKILLSVLFAGIMSLIVKVGFSKGVSKEKIIKTYFN
jgi:uncharacterized PurR-regulated membrane protein YhhQ (DUF165 family)